MRRRTLCGVAGMAFVLAGCATSGFGGLPAAQRADVERVQSYLAGLHGVQARFIQSGPGNEESAGQFLYDPGHLRMDYETPHEMHLVAGHGRLVLDDRGTGAVTRLGLSRNPLGLLLRTPVRFDDGIQVSDVRHGDGSLQVSAAEANNPSQGLLTLQFADHNGHLTLIGLDGVDARQHRIVIRLYDLTSGKALPQGVFDETSH